MKVKIKNYQAIKEAELNFTKGVNAIIGGTNNGKSSIIRAIRGAVNNQGGDSFINYDSDNTEVFLSIGANTLLWNKSKKQGKSFYQVNGTTYNKIGQKQLPEVAELMNMPEVEVNNDRFQINFWKQMDKPFLVDRTAYQLFDFISKSKEQEVVTTLKDLQESEYKDNTKQLDIINAQINAKTNEIRENDILIKKLEPIEDINLNELKALYNLIIKHNTIKNDLLSIDKQIDEAKYKVDQNNTIISDVESKIKGLNKSIKLIESIGSELEHINLQHNTLLRESDKLLLINNKISGIEHYLYGLEDKIDSFEKTNEAFLEINKLNSSIGITENKLTEYGREISDIEKELSKFKVCPLCGNTLDECKEA